MRLNLKNRHTYELALRLAELTGESLTTAVTIALEQRLEGEQRNRKARAKADRILEFAARFSAGMPVGAHSSHHADLFGAHG